MANTCTTYVSLKTKNDEKALRIAEYFDKLPERKAMGSDKGWLGIILYDLGIESENISKIETAGFIYDEYLNLNNGDNEISLYIDDKWGPHLDPIRLYLLSIGEEDVELSYQAEESGMGVFMGYGSCYNYSVTDIVVPESKYFHGYEGMDYFDNEQETIDFLKSIVKFPFETIDECVKKANEIIDKGEYFGDSVFEVNIFEDVHPQDITGNSDEALRKFLRTEQI